MDLDGIPPSPDDFRSGAGDEKLLVVFYMSILQDEMKSVEKGRPIFHDAEFVRIYIPGDKTSVVDRPAFEMDRRRFALQYAKFKQGIDEEDQISGTPLKEWPLVTRAQVQEFKYFHVLTVEHLAEARDDVKRQVPGMTQLSQQARIWLEKTNATAAVAMASQKIDEQANKISVLERTVAELCAERDNLRAQQEAA